MRIRISYLIIFGFSLTRQVLPEEETPPPEIGHYPCVQRISISHVEGINASSGYGTNYTSATLFLSPNYRLGRVLPILEGRVHRFDNHTYGANVGIGARYIPYGESLCHLLGANIFYDYRKGHRWNYNQIGFGFEALGKHLDFRGNIYIPLGIKQYRTCCIYDDYEGDWYARHYKCESVSFGSNAEIGYTLIDEKGFTFYAGTGPYYFSGRCLDQTIGWELRIRPQYKDSFAIDFKVHYDKLYQMVYQTTFILSLPLYEIRARKNQQKPCEITMRQIYQPVIRLETMPISRRSCWFTNFR